MQFNRLLGCALILLACGRASSAFTLRYYLDVQNNGTWNLYGSTDAPGGIAAAVVNLKNVTGGTSVAPRGMILGSANIGFTMGNLFVDRQAFAGQSTAQNAALGGASEVYGIGFTPVLDSSFMPHPVYQIIGTASSLPVRLYTGTWNPSGLMPEIDLVDAPTGAVFTSVGTNDTPAPAVIPEIHVPRPHLGIPSRGGDFDGNFVVDGADFVIWQTNFPTSGGSPYLSGDGDGDGDVDGADFVIWQTHFPLGVIPPWDPPAGDFDADGDVDGADFVAWQTAFPPPTTGFGPDVDGDGDTDGKEYVAWLVSFPYTPPPGGPVPEPAAVCLMGCAMLCLFSARHTRRARRN